MKAYIGLLPLAIQTFFSSNITTSTRMTIQHPPNPAWKAPFAAAISSQPVTFFQLATVSESLVPRCRTLTYAGFFGETPYAGASGIPASEQNPSGAESDVLLVASDARSSKFAQLQVSSSVEAVFFIAAQWTQFRVRGSAYPISFGARCGELERRGREHVEAHMARPDGWDWDKEIRKVWERQDEKMMKSKFPATTDETPVPDDFRLLVIVPDEILHLPPGGGPATTWTAEAKNGTAEWIKGEAAEH